METENTVCLVRREGSSLILQINRPEDANRITTDTMNALIHHMEQATEDPAIHSIIITGNREHFCCGGRVDPAADAQTKAAYSQAIMDLQKTMKKSPVPIIAAIEGDCKAGGNDILACSDIIVAREGVQFGFPEITYGSFPVMVIINMLDLIPQKKLLLYFYTGECFDAHTAEQYGMVTQVASDEEFWPVVRQYADALAKVTTKTLAIGRSAFYGMLPLNWEERVALGNETLRNVWKEQAASGKKY